MVQGYATSTKPMAYHGAVQDLMLLVTDILTNARNAVLPQLFQRLLPPVQPLPQVAVLQTGVGHRGTQQMQNARRILAQVAGTRAARV